MRLRPRPGRALLAVLTVLALLACLLALPHLGCTVGAPLVVTVRNDAGAPLEAVDVEAFAYCEWRRGRLRDRRAVLAPGEELRVTSRADYDLRLVRLTFACEEPPTSTATDGLRP